MAAKCFQMVGQVLLAVIVGKENGIATAENEDSTGQKDTGFPSDLTGMGPFFTRGVADFVQSIVRGQSFKVSGAIDVIGDSIPQPAFRQNFQG